MSSFEDKIVLNCPCCQSDKHLWKSVYYEDNATLKKANETYISWCSAQRKYVIQEKVEVLVELKELVAC